MPSRRAVAARRAIDGLLASKDFGSSASRLGPSGGHHSGEVGLWRDVCAAASARAVFSTEITGLRRCVQAIRIRDSTAALAPIACLISGRVACPLVAHTFGIVSHVQHFACAREVRTGAIIGATIAQRWVRSATVGISHAEATIAAVIAVIVGG